jgi:hypothetical protein
VTPLRSFCGVSDCAQQAGDGTTVEADRITAGTTINIAPFENFTITLQIYYIWINGFGLGPASYYAGGAVQTDSTDSSHWRAFSSYFLSFQYDVLPWLQVNANLSNSTQLAPVFSPDGSVRSPLNLNDLQVSAGLTWTLDGFYEAVTSAGEDDGLTPEQRQRRRQGLASRGSSGGTL